MDLPFYREYELPWTNSSGQERKFRRLLAIIMGVTFFLGVVWPWIPTPEKDPYQVDEIPYTLTGKKMEVPVRKILMGKDPEKSANKDAMSNPHSLDYFIRFREEHLDMLN